MSFPADITLPANAKYFAFVDNNNQYNPSYDITWSFQYALTGTEAGFCTFLTSQTQSTSALPGQYLGYSCSLPASAFLATESGEFILTEDYNRIVLEGNVGTDTVGDICIAFDTTGLFALSSSTRGGVNLNQIKRNSIIIREGSDNIIFYETLSSLNSSFSILSSAKSYKTLRFRYANTDTISIDFKYNTDSSYRTLTSVYIGNYLTYKNGLKAGFTFCSPISSLNTPSTLFFKNFHVQGTAQEETVEIIPFTKMETFGELTYNTLSGIYP
jgi:hypothetical protein